MSKKNTIIALIIIGLAGCFLTFYATNLFMSDISNMFYGVHKLYIFGTFPFLMFAVDLVFLFFFVMRLFENPENKKGLVSFYSLAYFVTSIIGIITDLIAALIIYGSFLDPYPFNGYFIICLALHIVILLFSSFIKFKVVPAMNGEIVKKMSILYCLYSFFAGLLLYYAFNKVGALLWSPFYIQWSTLPLTFVFYLSLLIPLFLVLNVMFKQFNAYKTNKQEIIFNSFIFILNIILFIPIYIIGYNDTRFISSVSMAVPLERLATMPMDSIFRFILGLLISGLFLLISVSKYKKDKNKLQKENS